MQVGCIYDYISKTLINQIFKQYKMELGDGQEHDIYQLQMLANAAL